MKTTISSSFDYKSVSSFETLQATVSSAIQTVNIDSSSFIKTDMVKDRSTHRSTSAALQTSPFQEMLKTAMMREGYARNRRASGTEIPARTISRPYRARGHRTVKPIMFRQDIVIDGSKKRQYLVRYNGQEESPLSYQDLEEL